jgi:hypothetical protein
LSGSIILLTSSRTSWTYGLIKAVKPSINPPLMITLSLNNLISRFIFLVALLLFVSGGFGAAQADPITLHARLVLGTCKDDKSKTEVSDKIRKRLAKVFKWMKYYELRSRRLGIDDGATKTVKLSKTAKIEVSNRKNGRIGVSLFSGGKMLVQKSQLLKPGSCMVLAGESGTDSAWFIVLSKDK